MICPDCSGAGRQEAIACPGGRLVVMRCQYCNATGAITEVQIEWRTAGQAHRTERISRDESMHECAKRLGIKASIVSSFERGYISPEEFSSHPTRPSTAPALKGSTDD